MTHQSSLGLCLHLTLGQEVDSFLHAPGVALIGCSGAGGGMLLLLLFQEVDSHLQDVSFLLLGVWMLPQEFLAQYSLEMLNAAVDAISAQFLNQRLSQLE